MTLGVLKGKGSSGVIYFRATLIYSKWFKLTLSEAIVLGLFFDPGGLPQFSFFSSSTIKEMTDSEELLEA